MGPEQIEEGKRLTLEDCPVGLFINSYGGLCLKTEYGNNEGRIDAYIVSSGEFFWGEPPQTIANQRKQLVTPVDEDALLATASEAEALRAEVGRLREAVALGRYWTQQRSSYGPDIAAVPGAIKAATDLQRIDALIATPIRGAAAGGSGE